MAKAYYGDKISNNITKLNNGCLVCFNVPIARTGTYKYLASEIGLEGYDVVDVYRTEDEVFSPTTLASFEGKPFTDNHPPCDVTVDNWQMYAKGTVTNVRRGTGANSGFLMADIIVNDPIVISEIQSGSKREISAGYECEYVEKGGKIYQKGIVGNHVALVQAGRAGKHVRINDEKKLPTKYKAIKKLEQVIKSI